MKKNRIDPMSCFLILSILQNIANNLAHPVTPTLIKNLNLGSYMFGVAFAAMAVGQFLFSPFWGKMTTVIGEKKQMSIGVITYALAQFLFMISKTELSIILARFLAGIGMGGFTVAALTYIIRISSSETRGQNLTYYTTITTVCSTFGYLLGGLLGDKEIYLSFMLQVALLMIIGILYYFFIQKSDNLEKLDSRTLIKEANPLQSIINGRKIMTGLLLLIFMAAFIASLASTAYDQSFNYYIKDIFDFKPSYNGYIKASVGIVSLIANMTLCIWIQKKKDLATSLIVIFTLCGISLFALTMAPNIAVLLTINMIYFATNSIYLPLIQNLCTRYSTSNTQGMVMGFFNSMKAMGMIVGALIAGFIYSVNPQYPFLVAACFFLVSAVIMLHYLQKKKAQSNKS